MTARSRQREMPDVLLKRYDPLTSAPVAIPEVEDVLAEIAQAIVRQPRQPQQARQRRSRRLASPRRLAVLVGTIAVLVTGAATAAVVLGAHTGLFPSKAEVLVGGPGEQLNPAAPDFTAVALKLAGDIPYPADYESWREWVLTVQFAKANVGPAGAKFPAAGLVTTGALRGWFAASAFRAWVQEWRQATV